MTLDALVVGAAVRAGHSRLSSHVMLSTTRPSPFGFGGGANPRPSGVCTEPLAKSLGRRVAGRPVLEVCSSQCFIRFDAERALPDHVLLSYLDKRCSNDEIVSRLDAPKTFRNRGVRGGVREVLEWEMRMRN